MVQAAKQFILRGYTSGSKWYLLPLPEVVKYFFEKCDKAWCADSPTCCLRSENFDTTYILGLNFVSVVLSFGAKHNHIYIKRELWRKGHTEQIILCKQIQSTGLMNQVRIRLGDYMIEIMINFRSIMIISCEYI